MRLHQLLRRISGLHHSLPDLFVRWNTLREGIERVDSLTIPCPWLIPGFLAVLTESLQIHCLPERALLQSAGLADNRPHLPRPAGYRNLDTGSARTNVTTTLAVHRRVLHVNYWVSPEQKSRRSFDQLYYVGVREECTESPLQAEEAGLMNDWWVGAGCRLLQRLESSHLGVLSGTKH